MKLLSSFSLMALLFAMPLAAGNHPAAKDLQQLRRDKRAIATAANELASVARASQIADWNAHAAILYTLKERIHASSERLIRIQTLTGSTPQLAEMRKELAEVAAKTNSIKLAIAENRLVTRTPGYLNEALQLVSLAERSRQVAERQIASVLSQPFQQTAD